MSDEWQPIETMPEDDTLKLIAFSGGGITVAPGIAKMSDSERKFFNKKLVKDYGIWPDHSDFTPTHWMPLPPHPALSHQQEGE